MTCATVGIAAAFLGFAAVAATIIRLAGFDDSARQFLRFTFNGPEASAFQLAAHNGRLVAAVLLAALAVPRLGGTRIALDCVLALVLVGNAAAVGAALGAYGARAAKALAFHGPPELAALSLAGGAYIRARRARGSATALLGTGAASLALLIVAGALEASTHAGGSR